MKSKHVPLNYKPKNKKPTTAIKTGTKVEIPGLGEIDNEYKYIDDIQATNYPYRVLGDNVPDISELLVNRYEKPNMIMFYPLYQVTKQGKTYNNRLLIDTGFIPVTEDMISHNSNGPVHRSIAIRHNHLASDIDTLLTDYIEKAKNLPDSQNLGEHQHIDFCLEKNQSGSHLFKFHYQREETDQLTIHNINENYQKLETHKLGDPGFNKSLKRALVVGRDVRFILAPIMIYSKPNKVSYTKIRINSIEFKYHNQEVRTSRPIIIQEVPYTDYTEIEVDI